MTRIAARAVLLFFTLRILDMRVLPLLIIAAALLAGCGYKAPLYLPESKPAAKKPVAKKPAPQQEEKKPDA
jgi:predicted small lipoprotein YifL